MPDGTVFNQILKNNSMKSLEQAIAAIQQVNIIRHYLTDDGTFPNNGLLPLLIYKKALMTDDGKVIKEIFESNRWVNAWQDGIYDYHHYHSTAHEVLGVFIGEARLQFGGPVGPFVPVEPGDIIVIPAGVAHKCIEHDEGFKVVGAYPDGQDYDIMKGEGNERPAADERIKNVPMPQVDPVYGADGPLLKNWAG
jgi:uncharacterized protein YjlB